MDREESVRPGKAGVLWAIVSLYLPLAGIFLLVFSASISEILPLLLCSFSLLLLSLFKSTHPVWAALPFALMAVLVVAGVGGLVRIMDPLFGGTLLSLLFLIVILVRYFGERGRVQAWWALHERHSFVLSGRGCRNF